MKIITLRSENVKRLHAVEIKPDGSNVVIIGGENGNGKSSVLDSIMYAMGGKGTMPPKPVRDGEEEATITVNLGDLVVTRTITPDGKGTLKVMGKDGGKHLSPQTILDNLVGNLSFDPLAFSRMEPKKQVDTLKNLVGLDFSPLERKKLAKSDERVLVGREVKQLQGQLAGMKQHADAPGAEVSVADLALKLTEARKINQENNRVRQDAAAAKDSAEQWGQRVIELEAELAEAKSAAETWAKTARTSLARVGTLKDANEQAVVDQMTGAETINRKVRDNQSRIRVSSELDQKQAAYETLSAEIHAIDQEKQRALATAEFPVAGLSFDETGVLVSGMPFQQASAAEQLKVSVAMGMALNPKLHVMLVRDASLLDSSSLKIVTEMAAAHDFQIWLERVSTDEPSAIVIEDGAVLRVNPARRARAATGGVA